VTKPKETAEEKLERMAAEEAIIAGKIKPVMAETLLELVRNLKKPYAKLDEYQQGEFIQSFTRRINAQLDVAIGELARGEHRELHASIASFTAKGDTIKIQLETHLSLDSLAILGGVGITGVTLFVPDNTVKDDHTNEGPQPEPTAPELPIEEAIAERTAKDDDMDLSAEAEEQQEEPA